MTTTMTFRLPKKQRDKLRSRAKALGQSEAEVLRNILARELEPGRLGDRIGHLAGSVGKRLRPMDEWQKQIKKNNWRS